MYLESYDVAVVGGGHAGIEAAVAAARLGAKVALFTLSLDAIGNLPCNPSIGGTAKGHLVREIDALGGCMGLAADATFLQSRMLNRGKGPAVHSLRVQTDRAQYHLYAKALLEKTEGLSVIQAEVEEVLTKEGRACGVRTRLGANYAAKAVILATGTYLNGRIFIGEANYASGPDGTSAAQQLTQSLQKLGLHLRRFKTGTPARVHRRSIAFEKLERQPGDAQIIPFSFLTKGKLENKVDCYIAYTNAETHRIIQENLHRSPLYAGNIEGIGPRYCPSIEDKVVRFADKPTHQIFVEPCGLGTEEYYLQGMSSSLPLDVQVAMYRTIEGFENLEIMRPAYAIEYDCMDPIDLAPTLECMQVPGLYGAGQFNGTSGYEEAAAQGLLAGVNATRMARGEEQIVLARQQSYIGTMVDDLVTKGVSDPYRMMTSRSEYRLYLRQDNADERLTPLGRQLGLVSDKRWEVFGRMLAAKNAEIKRLENTTIKPEMAQPLLLEKGLPPLKTAVKAMELLRRPQWNYRDIASLIGPGSGVDDALAARIETETKYEGYIKRQLAQIEAVKKQEDVPIPQEFTYEGLDGLRLEAREKLGRVRPRNVGQAARVPGVSPSDIAQLTLALALHRQKIGKIRKQGQENS
ncbi:tRNA uridine-5-carboxymethylaminomethyl(34) synthesis enzyme MnmG [Ruminococcaceae bacterium OttesenSCG-928-O06]|nr:tRNA uridine-5-carboxymethylaminomethyl(34) synthesis enzyme MnmG [Ruminococcaceae bacterium OttesenSCG-928-O06]